MESTGGADHVDARRHHAARLGLAEADDPPQPLPLLGLEDPLAGADVDEGLDLLVGGGVVLPLLVALERLGGDRAAASTRDQRRQQPERGAVEAGQRPQRPLRVLADERPVDHLDHGHEEEDDDERPEHRVGPVRGWRGGR